MAYGSSYGNRNYGGGYQRQGGYQQTAQAPAPQPVDVHEEITKRVDLFMQFKDVIVNEKGVPVDEFFMMVPALGGWVTSIILKGEKGK